jgi:aminopeptidase N
MKFEGRAVISGVKVGRPSKRLTFHQKNLKIKNVKVTFQGQKAVEVLKVSRINTHKNFEEVRLHFDSLIYNGRYQIEIDYVGLINPQLHGIYVSKFKDKTKSKTIVCTQFESHHAREAFPSIDEPEAKSIFNLTLRTAANQVVISNTDPEITKKAGAEVLTKFKPTPLMSSYLLAFVVGDLKYLEARTDSNIRVRTYATPDNVSYTKFALECAVRTLNFYEEYFAIAYPLTKCDLIALPDFSSGAMENWGCVTFREQALLVDPSNTSLYLKQFVAEVVAHELTHQWFGNLVTMSWWNDLWLNESFATWMSYLALEKLFPDWQAWTQFIVDSQAVGLRQDSLENTHPIEVKINNPDEIRTVFDSISYEKGASVITMLHDYLGAEFFKEGIRLYLSKNAYSNTSTIDLWRALEQASDKPVEQFMSRWTGLGGYPLVKTTYSEGNVHLEQHRFYLNPMAKKEASLWPVPLFTELDFGKNDPFAHRSLNVALDPTQDGSLFNKGRHGFYRVIYDDQTISELLDDDFMESVADVDRLGLIADAFEAAKGGYLPTLSVLNMLEHYFTESSSVVWDVMAGGLGSLKATMDDEDLREAMKPYIRELVKSELDRLGFKSKSSDSHFDKLLRPTIMGMAAAADEPTVVNEVKRLFYDKPSENIEPELRGVVYSTIARLGKTSDFDLLLSLHNKSNSPEERLKLVAGLTSFKQASLHKRALDLIRSDNVKTQDVAYWIAYSFSNHYSRDASWKWLKDNWDWLDENMGEDLSFYRLPFYAARCYSSLEFLKEFEAFFDTRLSAAFDRPIKQAVETIQWQADWKRRDLEAIRRYFAQWSKSHSV